MDNPDTLATLGTQDKGPNEQKKQKNKRKQQKKPPPPPPTQRNLIK